MMVTIGDITGSHLLAYEGEFVPRVGDTLTVAGSTRWVFNVEILLGKDGTGVAKVRTKVGRYDLADPA